MEEILTSEQIKKVNTWSNTIPKTGKWIGDPVMKANRQIELVFRLDKDFNGHYTKVEPDGELEIGTVEGAIPYITDGIFYPMFTMKLDLTAAIRLRNKLLGK